MGRYRPETERLLVAVAFKQCADHQAAKAWLKQQPGGGAIVKNPNLSSFGKRWSERLMTKHSVHTAVAHRHKPTVPDEEALECAKVVRKRHYRTWQQACLDTPMATVLARYNVSPEHLRRRVMQVDPKMTLRLQGELGFWAKADVDCCFCEEIDGVDRGGKWTSTAPAVWAVEGCEALHG